MSDFENHVREMFDAFDRRLTKQEARISALYRRLTLLGGVPDDGWLEEFDAASPEELEQMKRELLEAAELATIQRGVEAAERRAQRSGNVTPLRPEPDP